LSLFLYNLICCIKRKSFIRQKVYEVLTPKSYSKFETKTAVSTLHVMLYPQVSKYFMEAPPLLNLGACVPIMFHCYRSVSVVNRLGTERSWNSSIPGMDRRVPLPPKGPDRLWVPPSRYRVFFPGGKDVGA
jgi:hypothetical protein